MAFKKAEKKAAKLRAQIVGPSGSGKTWTALELATELRKKWGGKVALIDSERGSASKYADRFEFDVMELDSFSPKQYVAAIKEAEAAGYTILIVDSISHEWAGTGGVLEKVDNAGGSNKWAGWRVGTPLHNEFIDSLLQTRCHVIATARAKTEWVLDDSNGKKVPRAVGMGAVQRDGVEFEFDLSVHLDAQHHATVTKTRAPSLDGRVLRAPGPELAAALVSWLDGGTPAPAEKQATNGAAVSHAETTPPAQGSASPAPEAVRTAGNGSAPADPASPSFAERIAQAPTFAALLEVGRDVQKARKDGALKEDLTALRQAYDVRQHALTTSPA